MSSVKETSAVKRECKGPKPFTHTRICQFAIYTSPDGEKVFFQFSLSAKRCRNVHNKPIFVCVLYLLDHDGKGSEHLEASCEVHDIAPSQHQGKGHGDHLTSYAGETHHHGY